MDRQTLESILDQEAHVFRRLEKSLGALIEATKNKDAARIGSLTEELTTTHGEAESLDRKLITAANAYADRHGIPRTEFRLSKMAEGTALIRKVDELKERVASVARLSNEASGILAANVGVIQDTIKILESLDARSVGYGAEKAPRRPSKMIDRSA